MKSQYKFKFESQIQKMSDFLTDQNRTAGRWTKLQHEKFLTGLELYGKDWKKIEALVGTRSGAQIRSHAQKYFIRKVKDLPESAEEVEEQTTPLTPSSSITAPAEGFSYFLAKIVGRYSLEEDFDFWGDLVDNKPHWQTVRPIRKGSFVTISSESSSEYERAPFKRVKSDSSSPLSHSLSSLPQV